MPKRIVVGSSCAAALLSVMAVAATGQSAPQNPTPSPRGTESPTQSRVQGERSAADQQITVVGCVANESDLKGGGAAGADRSAREGASPRSSGGNEFVLLNAQVMPAAASSSSGLGGSTGSTATGTSGSTSDRSAAAGSTGDRSSASPGVTFNLTGSRERELSKYVGERVEIVGKMESGSPSAGASAPGRPGDDPIGSRGDQGRDGDRSDADRGRTDSSAPSSSASGGSSSSASMPRVEIVSFKPATGSCQ
jgi:hypothetical protein